MHTARSPSRAWIGLGLAVSLVLAQTALAVHDVRHHAPDPVVQCELCTVGSSLTASVPDNTPVYPLRPTHALPVHAAPTVAAHSVRIQRARGPPHHA